MVEFMEFPGAPHGTGCREYRSPEAHTLIIEARLVYYYSKMT
jgi:hypothetical protein